ncbi:MAG: hypothetical protein ABI315_09495 [Bacteroidia bacterium]
MKNLILTSIISGVIFFTSCHERPTESRDKNIVQIKDSTLQKDSLKPDISINKQLFLQNPESVEKVFIDIMPLLNKEAEFPDLYMFNNNKKEYLRMVLFPGSSKNSISQFEVGYYSDLPANTKTTSSKLDSFYTESQIKLGIAKEHLIMEKGKNFKEENAKDNQSIIRYTLSDFNKSDFLKRYNMPVYFAEYWFKSNKLIKYRFGFEYP